MARCGTPGKLLNSCARLGNHRAVVSGPSRPRCTRHPPAATHWSTRSLAKAQGLSEATIRHIWKQHGLKPHLIRTFKISHDKQFVEKLYDVVGLYLNPPAKSLMLSVAWRAMC